MCVQETRQNGEKARWIGGGYKMWYCGSENKKNDVEIILKKEHVDRVVKLWRVTNSMIDRQFDGVMLNAISVYAPQVGYKSEEKEAFWLDLDETVEEIPKNERIVVGADLNGRVGEGITVMKNAWANTDWGRQTTKDQQWWILLRKCD